MKFLSFLCTKWMENCEAMTSSTHSFAYSYGLVKKCFLKICETSKFHNFLIFQPIFIRFSLFCSENFTLSSKIKLDQLRTSPLTRNLKIPWVDFHQTWYRGAPPGVDELIRFWARAAQCQRSKNLVWICYFYLVNTISQKNLGGFSSNLAQGCTMRSRWTDSPMHWILFHYNWSATKNPN